MDASQQQSPEAEAVDATRTGGVAPRVLIVKFGAIGDVLMAVPAAAALHAAGYGIDWVASTVIAPLLRLYSWIHVVEVNEPHLLRGSSLEKLKAVLPLTATLRRRVGAYGAYDLIATLYYDRRYSYLTSLVPAKRRLRLSRVDRRFTLLPGRHHADEYLRILCARPDQEWPFQVAPVELSGLPASPRAANAEGRARVALVPAGARNALRDDALRRWPVDAYVELAGSLLQAGCEVVLVGGPEDRWASAHFAALAREADPGCFADLIGSLRLVETAALLHSSAVTVTHDTGPLHVAGVTSTAIVAIFGPTDPHGRLPQRGNAVAVWGGEGFGCRPCYDGRDYAPCPHNGCMSQVSPAMVLAEVLGLLETRAKGKESPPRVTVPARAGLVQIGTVTP